MMTFAIVRAKTSDGILEADDEHKHQLYSLETAKTSSKVVRLCVWVCVRVSARVTISAGVT